MIVTKFKYPLENNLIKKIDLMIDRCVNKKSKKDTVLLCEGAEGEGKTTLSIAIAYYVAEKTGRKFDHKKVFFNVEDLVDFAKNTKDQIIIWDEPALQALATDWATGVVKNITRLLMMARKNRHFFIFNIAKFYKFNEYIVVDRPMGLIHVYSRKNIESGRFIYIRKKNLEGLWRDYRFSKKRNYKKYSSRIIRGTFPSILDPAYKNNVLSHFDNEAYEEAKDKAIQSIGENKIANKFLRWFDQRNNLIKLYKKENNLSFLNLTKKLKQNGIDMGTTTIREACENAKN